MDNNSDLALRVDLNPEGGELGVPLAVVYSKPMGELAADCPCINNLLAQWLLVGSGWTRRQDAIGTGGPTASRLPCRWMPSTRGIVRCRNFEEWGYPAEKPSLRKEPGYREEPGYGPGHARVLGDGSEPNVGPVVGVFSCGWGTGHCERRNSPAQGVPVATLRPECWRSYGRFRGRRLAFVVVVNGFVDNPGKHVGPWLMPANVEVRRRLVTY